MYTITGAFNQRSDAELALQALHEAGFALDAGPSNDPHPDAESAAIPTPDPEFDVSPEPAESAGAEDAPQTAAKGVAVGGALGFVVGLGALPVLGPLAPLAGAGVGAYGGSLLGALKGLKSAEEVAADPATPPDQRDPHAAHEAADHATIERGEGAVITVVAHAPEGRTRAVDLLWSYGAVTVVEGE
jgi:hypothetical protein